MKGLVINVRFITNLRISATDSCFLQFVDLLGKIVTLAKEFILSTPAFNKIV